MYGYHFNVKCPECQNEINGELGIVTCYEIEGYEGITFHQYRCDECGAMFYVSGAWDDKLTVRGDTTKIIKETGACAY